jgi:hypothetical protein
MLPSKFPENAFSVKEREAVCHLYFRRSQFSVDIGQCELAFIGFHAHDNHVAVSVFSDIDRFFTDMTKFGYAIRVPEILDGADNGHVLHLQRDGSPAAA